MKTVLDLARQAGWTGPEDNLAYISMLERFAKLVLAHNPPQSFMSWQEGYEAGKLAERERVQAFMRQMFDAYSLSSDPGGLKNRGNK